ncbi:hypothetical protein BH10PSE12_BH10PSE12_02960 [soil metagenome]
MSLHGSEQVVMDLWDSGLTMAQITARTGFSDTKVRQFVSMYGGAGASTREMHAGFADGTDALGEALRRVHPERCVL